MPSFKGTQRVVIQPNSADVGYRFHCTTCTSSSSNDGHLPYNTTISGVTITAKTEAGVVDTELIASTALSTPDIDLTLSYPATNGPGRYSLTFVLAMDNSSTLELDFDRVYVKDL